MFIYKSFAFVFKILYEVFVFAYFSLRLSFMVYGATVWDQYQNKYTIVIKLRGCGVVLQGSLKTGILNTLVFLILFCEIINGLTQVSFECVLIEAVEENKFRQIGYTIVIG